MSDSQEIPALDGTTPDPLDDPRLTALALGELSDAGLAALEADLDDLARRDVRREADEIARFAASLGAALRTDEAGLDSGRRAAILAASLGVAKRATVLPLPAARARVLRRVVQWSAGGAVAAGLALTVVPNLVEARKHGNEAAAIGALKTTNSAETLFREGDKEPQTPLDYGSIAQISNTTLIDGVLGNTRKQGYTFQLPAPTVSGEFLWFANANPNAPTSTSDRFFGTITNSIYGDVKDEVQGILQDDGELSVATIRTRRTVEQDRNFSQPTMTAVPPFGPAATPEERDSRLQQVDMGTSFGKRNGQFKETGETRELDDLRREKNDLQDANIELARRFDVEKQRLAQEKGDLVAERARLARAFELEQARILGRDAQLQGRIDELAMLRDKVGGPLPGLGGASAPDSLPSLVRLNALTGPTAAPPGDQAEYGITFENGSTTNGLGVNGFFPQGRVEFPDKAHWARIRSRNTGIGEALGPPFGEVHGNHGGGLVPAGGADPSAEGSTAWRADGSNLPGDYVYRSKDVPLGDDGNPDYEDEVALSPGPVWRGGADVPGRWRELADRYAANVRIGDYELSSAGLGTARIQVDGVWYDLPTSKPTPTESTTLEGLYTDGWRPTPLIEAAKERQSTFAIDVDTASYARVRSSIRTQSRWPAASTVRVEELVNYHAYDYAAPTDGRPLAASSEVTTCPWAPDRRLVRIGLRGRGLEGTARPAANLVFLIDVSGSMGSVEKLPLVQRALTLLVSQLGERDRVSIVVYAGASGCVLDGASGADKATILGALERLQAGGSTNGGAGIELAYELCSRRFIEGGVNRVILCTDGDWNVGARSQQDLEELIARKAKGNLSLTALGFGMSEGGDRTLETLADRGDGNYAYVDGLPEARRVLVEQLDGTLVTIGKDVKVQVEWDPAAVLGYTLVGYEDRRLANQDFANDAKDAGDVGARHAVTALYEVKLATDAKTSAKTLGTLRLRWKAVTSGQAAQASELLEVPLTDDGRTLETTSVDTRFAMGVAAFALGLKAGPGPGRQLLEVAQALADGARGADPHGLRADFSELVRTARGISR